MQTNDTAVCLQMVRQKLFTFTFPLATLLFPNPLEHPGFADLGSGFALIHHELQKCTPDEGATRAKMSSGGGRRFLFLANLAQAHEPELGGWTIVWSDEFGYTGHPNPDKWGYEEGYVRHHELQYYKVNRLENLDGLLTARCI